MSRLSSDNNSNPKVTGVRNVRNVLYENGLPATKESSKLRKISYSDKRAGLVPINNVTENLEYVHEETEETEETEDMDDTCDSISDDNNNYAYTGNVPQVIDSAQVNYLPTTQYYYVPNNTTLWNALEPTQTRLTFEEKAEGFLMPLLEQNKNEKLLDYNTQPLTTYYNKHTIEANNNNIIKNTPETEYNNLNDILTMEYFGLDSYCPSNYTATQI